MCVFRNAPLVAEHGLTYEAAIEAYKGFDATASGYLTSPYQGYYWHTVRANTECLGASAMHSMGFHSLRNMIDLSQHDGTFICRVKLFGNVFEYAQANMMPSSWRVSPHGYLSSDVEIVEVVALHRASFLVPNMYRMEALRQMPKVYPELQYSEELRERMGWN